MFKGVSKRYGNGTLALDNVSFYVEKGEFVFIVGASGSGKTTITKLIMCEERPTSGNIFINNNDITFLPHEELPYYRRRLGMVFQDFRLLPKKTVFENVAFGMRVTGASKRDIRRKVPAVLNMVGLANKAKVKADQLSGGEQQRVSLARAVVNTPPVLIADEPTGNLDPNTADEIMQILEAINCNGTTVLIVTHASDIVNKMQKRVIEIQAGQIVRDQTQGAYIG